MSNFIPKIEYIELLTLTPKTITFDTPPEGDPLNESYRSNAITKRTTAGVKQTQFNFNMKTYKFEFIFQSETIKDAFDDFYLNHASRGGTFNYFIHSDEIEFETFDYQSKSYRPKRPIPSATPGEFEYDIGFTVERVV